MEFLGGEGLGGGGCFAWDNIGLSWGLGCLRPGLLCRLLLSLSALSRRSVGVEENPKKQKSIYIYTYKLATAEPYSFLYCDLRAKTKHEMFMICLDKKISIDDD